MITSNKVILNAVDASVNVTGPAYYLKLVYGFALDVVFTGTVNGSLSLQGSCDAGSQIPDEPEFGTGIVNWTTIANSTVSITGAGPVTYNFNGVFYKWVRLVYAASSGTGTLTATMNTKGE